MRDITSSSAIREALANYRPFDTIAAGTPISHFQDDEDGDEEEIEDRHQDDDA
jgi:hypothetical protein